MTGVVDYGMGNLKSICNAVAYVGAAPRVCTTPEAIQECDRLIIPGVGAYQLAMQNLQGAGLVPAIHAFAESARPVLGICLGMQLLSTWGTEPEHTAGLNLIPGDVVSIPESANIRVPHVGWNACVFSRPHPLFANVRQNLDYYFVHSYRYIPVDPNDSLAVTEYGVSFTSIVARKNIVGVQFHPEKSQEHGLRLIENFLAWNGVC